MEELDKKQRLALAQKLAQIKQHPHWTDGLLRMAREVKETFLIEMGNIKPRNRKIIKSQNEVRFEEAIDYKTEMSIYYGKLQGIDYLFNMIELLVKELEKNSEEDWKSKETDIDEDI